MNYKLAVIIPSIIMLVICLNSCSDHTDYSIQISTLDSTKKNTEDMLTRCQAAALSWASQYPDSMLYRIRFIQENFKGVMKTEDALSVSSYSNAAQDMLQVKINLEDVNSQLAAFHHEITSLQKALKENATHDKAGNEINEKYVQDVLEIEKDNMKRFDERLESLENLLSQARESASNHASIILHMTDSLNNTSKRK
jgi:hypothetical protein